MTDFFFRMGLSNAVFSLALAIVAVVVGATAKRPYLAHMLWLLVFVKLVTRPIVTIPFGVSSPQPNVMTGGMVVSDFDIEAEPAAAVPALLPSLTSDIAAKLNAAKPWLASIWLLGSLLILVWSARRVYRCADRS